MPPSLPSERPIDPSHMLTRPHEALRPALPEEKRAGSIGPLIGAIIIIVLLAFGALYFYGEYLNRQNSEEPLPLIGGNA